jgi:hypothetical protein
MQSRTKITYDTDLFAQKDLFSMLDFPLLLKVPLRYERYKPSTKYTSLCKVVSFGLMGHGKSTTGNYILRESIMDTRKWKAPPSGWFRASRNFHGVTKEVTIGDTDTLSYIDTCGFDDTDPKRSAANNMSNIFRSLKEILSDPKGGPYLNGIVFCIMKTKSGRVDQTLLTTIANVLLGFTLTYPDCCSQRIFFKIVMNNFSKDEYYKDVTANDFGGEEGLFTDSNQVQNLLRKSANLISSM